MKKKFDFPNRILSRCWDSREFLITLTKLNHLDRFSLCDDLTSKITNRIYSFVLLKKWVSGVHENIDNNYIFSRALASNIFNIPLSSIPDNYNMYWWINYTNEYTSIGDGSNGVWAKKYMEYVNYYIALPILGPNRTEKIIF